MSVRWLAVVLLLVSCGGSAEVATTTSIAAAGGCADVIAATAELAGDGTYTFTASVVSDDTGWDKYADAWIIRAGGEEIGRRVLTHPHETEQPFTRSLNGVAVPESVSSLAISAHDSVRGECGAVFELSIGGE